MSARSSSATQAFLGIAATLGFLAVVFWQAVKSGAVDADLKQALIAILFTAFGFFLGSSKGSQDKTNATLKE